jgi:hypothetical protein
MRQTISAFLLLASLMGCTITEKAKRDIKFSILAGMNHGGIIENADLSLIANLEATPGSTIDAYSGATRIGANAGVHINKPLHYGEIETGLDYMYNNQCFSYADQGNSYVGTRELHVNQIMFPFTCNFVLFKKWLPSAEVQLKLGYLGQYNMASTSGTGILPGFSINKWSNGATLGLSAYPIKFGNGSKLGLYLDAYRGSRIYTDYYNQEGFEMPGSGFVKFGVRYQLAIL